MNTGEKFVARSGLKPFGMLITCLFLFVVIAGRVTDGVVSRAHDNESSGELRESDPDNLDLDDFLVSRTHIDPKWDVVDREGRTLATDVHWRRLSASPRSMWQAHTPTRIAQKLEECLEPEHREGWQALLDRLLPDASSGVIQVKLYSRSRDGEESVERFLEESAVKRLDDWLISGEEGVPVSGMWLQQVGSEGKYRICWMPELLLSYSTREAQGFRKLGEEEEGYTDRPSSWCRRIASRLAPCLGLKGLDPAKEHGEVWKQLMPDQNEVIFDRLSIAEGQRVSELLSAEGIADVQMRLSWYRERAYPVAEGSDIENGFGWLGRWRFRTMKDCLDCVMRRHGLTSRDSVSEEMQRTLRQEINQEATLRVPMTRLEKTCEELFKDEFKHLKADAAEYSFLAFNPAHSSRQRSFYGAAEEDERSRVHTTIDAPLQNYLRRVLFETMTEHDAALVEGIVIDVKTGEVLAIDGVCQYEQAQFLPLQYGFTPGSTFKPLVAASALELGVVSPNDRFRTFNRELHLGGRDDVEGWCSRTVREARNSELGVDGYLTLREGVAHSINGVMVQVGLRMPMEYLHSTLINLGYGQPQETALGMSGKGIIRPYKDWTRCWTQASVSFGHEFQCTLWQHAAALSTVLRGGEYLPLRVVRSVEGKGQKQRVRAKPSHGVFSDTTCEEVRGMLRLAAQIGTGERFYEELVAAGTPVVFGSKTGTTEKEPGTSCSHIELSCAQENAERKRENVERKKRGEPLLPYSNCTKEGRDARKGGAQPHSNKCYTSSMMVFGSVGDPQASLPRAGEEREVMVIIVVEEPRGRGYYGSQVAGPAAIAVLLEALYLTRDGQPLVNIAPSQTSVPKDVTQRLSEDPVQEISDRDQFSEDQVWEIYERYEEDGR